MSLLDETGHYTTTDADHVNWMEKCSNAFSIIAHKFKERISLSIRVEKESIQSNPIFRSECRKFDTNKLPGSIWETNLRR